jgi:DNA-binding SARP family transcriptional activator
MMRFGVLGPVAAWSDGQPIALGGLRQRGLLALLLDWSPAQIAADRLVDQLWNGTPPPTASSALRVHLAKLRAALRAGGGDVLTGTAGYHVDLTTHALDADEFEGLLAKAAGSSGTTALEALDAALALWRGDPFADLDSVVALAPAAERLRERRAGALERRAELLVSLGRLDDAVAQLQDLVRANPLRERPTELLMSALYQQGRQADALRAYRYLRTTLVEELGVEPGPSVRKLEHAILLQDSQLDRSAVGTLPVPAAPANWPAALDLIARRPFVGRVTELTRLAGLHEAADQGSRVVVINGPAGIGKTSLAAQFAARLNAAGTHVVYGWSDQSGLPYESFRVAVGGLRAGAGGGRAVTDARREALAPLLSDVVADPRPTDDLDSRRARLFAAVADTLAELSADNGVALVLDDAHRLDEASTALLDHVLRVNAAARLLVVVTHRSGEPRNPGWDSLVADLTARGIAVLFEVAGLSGPDVAELVSALAGDRLESDALVADLLDATGGNPLYLHQVAGELRDADGLLTSISLPATSRAAISKHLDQVPADCARLVGAGAVLGRTFDLLPAGEVAGLDVGAAIDAVDAALAAGLIEELDGQPDRFRFVHGLMEQVAYTRLSSSRRCRWHATAREVLANRPDPARPEALARHSRAALPAGDPLLAIADAERAAEAAMADLDFERAAGLLRDAVDLNDTFTADDEHALRRCRLLVGLGKAVVRTDDGSGLTILSEAAQLARDLGLDAELAAAALGRFGSDLAPNPTQISLLEEVRQRLLPEPSVTRVKVLGRLALDRRELDPTEGSRQCAEEALGAARALGDDALTAWALNALSVVSRAFVRASQRLPLVDDAIFLAERASDEGLALQARHTRTFDLLELGATDRVLDVELPEIEARARRAGWARSLWYAGFMRAGVLLYHGADDATFSAAAKDAARIGTAAGIKEAPLTLAGGHIGRCWRNGTLDEMRATIESAIPAYPGIPVWRSILACALADGGDLDCARHAVDDLIAHDFTDFPRGQMFIPSLAFLVRPLVALAHRSTARRVRKLLAPFAGQLVVVGAGIIVMGGVDDFRDQLNAI